MNDCFVIKLELSLVGHIILLVHGSFRLTDSHSLTHAHLVTPAMDHGLVGLVCDCKDVRRMVDLGAVTIQAGVLQAETTVTNTYMMTQVHQAGNCQDHKYVMMLMWIFDGDSTNSMTSVKLTGVH